MMLRTPLLRSDKRATVLKKPTQAKRVTHGQEPGAGLPLSGARLAVAKEMNMEHSIDTVQRLVPRKHFCTDRVIIPIRKIHGGKKWKCRRSDNGFEFVMPTSFILDIYTRI